MIIIYFILFLLGLISAALFLVKRIKRDVPVPQLCLATAYILSLLAMFIGLLMHSNQYGTAIDAVDGECYIPFGGKHIITLIFYFIAFNISLLLLWLKGDRLPPLTKVLALAVLMAGIVICVPVLLQVLGHNTASIDLYDRSEHVYLFLFAPVLSIIVSVLLIVRVVKAHMIIANDRIYVNRYLNRLNTFLARKSNLTIGAIILILPILLLVTAVLSLFGQDTWALVKVFTETTTWRFSQHLHPPVLDHKGHYLCTVAASGSPEVIKPIRLGKRNGRVIIVNRQLLIANAFEEMIQQWSPALHKVIRHSYDKYGYNLSRKINNERMANLTYRIMKPLEWLFLIALYLFCLEPERRINKQYRMTC